MQTDKHLAHNILNTAVVKEKQVWLIYVATPWDSRIDNKEVEIISKNQDLKVEKVERLLDKDNSRACDNESPTEEIPRVFLNTWKA